MDSDVRDAGVGDAASEGAEGPSNPAADLAPVPAARDVATLATLPAELLPPIFARAMWPPLRRACRALWAASRSADARAGWIVAVKGGVRFVFSPGAPGGTAFGAALRCHPLLDDPVVLDRLLRLGAPLAPPVLADAVLAGRRRMVSWFLDTYGVQGPPPDMALIERLAGHFRRLAVPADPDFAQDADPEPLPLADDPDPAHDSDADHLVSPRFLCSLVTLRAAAADDVRTMLLLFLHPILRHAFPGGPARGMRMDLTDPLLACGRRGSLACLELLLALTLPGPNLPRELAHLSAHFFLPEPALQSALRAACARDRPAAAARLLAAGADPNSDLGGTDNPPLSHASWRGHARCALALLRHGARPDPLSLFLASSRGHVACMRHIIAHGGRAGEDLLWYAGSRGEEGVVRFLVGECRVPVEGCAGMWRVGGRADVASWVEGIARQEGGKGMGRLVGAEAAVPDSATRRRSGEGAVPLDAIIDSLVPDAPSGVPSGMFDPGRHSGWFGGGYGSLAPVPHQPVAGPSGISSVSASVSVSASSSAATSASSSTSSSPAPSLAPSAQRPAASNATAAAGLPPLPSSSSITPSVLAQTHPHLAPAAVTTVSLSVTESGPVSDGPKVMVTAPTPTSGTRHEEPPPPSPRTRRSRLAPPDPSGRTDAGARMHDAAAGGRKRGSVVYYDDEGDEIVAPEPAPAPRAAEKPAWGAWEDGWVDVSDEPPKGRSAKGKEKAEHEAARKDEGQGTKRPGSWCETGAGTREGMRRSASYTYGGGAGHAAGGWAGKDSWGGW